MYKVVFDTVVFVRSLINPYGRWGELIFKYYDRYLVFVSQPIVEEYLEVLHRPELTGKFRTLSNLDLEKIIDIIKHAPMVKVPTISSASRDPKDNKFLATSCAASADYLISEDKDLLDIKEYQGVKIITTLDFLHILEKIDENGN